MYTPSPTTLSMLTLILMLTVACSTTKQPDPVQTEGPKTPSASAAPNTARKAPAAATVTIPPAMKPCPQDTDHDDSGTQCRVKRLGNVVLDGWLKEDVLTRVVVEKLGQPEKKKERFDEAATGNIYETWAWPSQGVSLDMAAPNMKDPVEHALSFVVKAPFKGRTDRGVGIGTPEADALKAYPYSIDPHATEPGVRIVLGSMFGGMIFGITDGKVSSIFVGAASE